MECNMNLLIRITVLSLMAVGFSACEILSEKEQQPQVEKPLVLNKQDAVRARNTANKLDLILKQNGSIYKNKKVTAYLQSIMNKLYPRNKGRMRVKILKFSHLNAFALANGTIYFNLGLIARLKNEAQLATVLGHEGAHFVYKHTLKKRHKIKTASEMRRNKSTIYGYTRGLERQADRHAFLRLKKSGYNTAEAYKVFEHLLAEVKLLQGHKLRISRLHPKLIDRITSFKKLHTNSGNSKGVKNTRRYNLMMRDVKIADLEENLAANNYKSVILILDRPGMEKEYPKFYTYYLGEAYRLRGGADDYSKAENSYLMSTRNAPEFAPAYNALGVY